MIDLAHKNQRLYHMSLFRILHSHHSQPYRSVIKKTLPRKNISRRHGVTSQNTQTKYHTGTRCSYLLQLIIHVIPEHRQVFSLFPRIGKGFDGYVWGGVVKEVPIHQYSLIYILFIYLYFNSYSFEVGRYLL